MALHLEDFYIHTFGARPDVAGRPASLDTQEGRSGCPFCHMSHGDDANGI